jgi:hypothetical protein
VPRFVKLQQSQDQSRRQRRRQLTDEIGVATLDEGVYRLIGHLNGRVAEPLGRPGRKPFEGDVAQLLRFRGVGLDRQDRKG